MAVTPSISVVIVSYNCRDLLRGCLASLERAEGDLEIIVVDNASTDGTLALVEEQYPGVRLLANEDNPGFAAANNQGAAQATGDVLCFLNPDTEVAPDALVGLARCVLQPGHGGIAGPLVLFPSGSRQQSYGRAPNLLTETLFFTVTILKHIPNPVTCWKNLGRPRTSTTAVDWVSGCCLALPRTLFRETGGWNEAFFAYYEDIALCTEARRRGRPVTFEPAFSMVHHHGGSYAGKGEGPRVLDGHRSAGYYLELYGSPRSAKRFRQWTRRLWALEASLLGTLHVLTLGRFRVFGEKRDLLNYLCTETPGPS